MGVEVFGDVDRRSLEQLERCREPEPGTQAVLCADHHPGYSMPIGGVIAYRNLVSPSAVGFDIGCGNLAARTNLRYEDLAADMPRLMDRIARELSFGMGRRNAERVDDPVLDRVAHSAVTAQRTLAGLARDQLGTIGGGNHYVDLFADEAGWVWVGVHFGSRGLGHRTASGFLALAKGRGFGERVSEGGMDAPPTVVRADSPLGADYIEAMQIAGEYAYAGRQWVVDKVVREILRGQTMEAVHNHHNFAWQETHAGERFWVHRKGATPAFAGQRGFVGGSMGEPAVILRGIASERSSRALYSTVHGAGRVLSRTQAAGRYQGWGARRRQVSRGIVNWPRWQTLLRDRGIELRGGGADEAPECYKRLPDVLAAHAGTVEIEHTLTPVGVAMAGEETEDLYRD